MILLAIFYKCWAEKPRFVKVCAFDDDNQNCLLKVNISSWAFFFFFTLLSKMNYTAVSQFPFNTGI